MRKSDTMTTDHAMGGPTVLKRDTPVRLHGMLITILAGETIEVGPRQDDGSPHTSYTCWAPRAKDGGPAALAPFAVGEEYLGDVKSAEDALEHGTGQTRR